MGVVEELDEALVEDLVDCPLGGGFGLGLGQAVAEGFQVGLERTLKVFIAGGLADDVFEASAVVVADVEVDGFPFPFRLGGQSAQPAEDDLGIGVGVVQQGNARLDGDGVKVATGIGEIDADESSGHGSICLRLRD